MGAGDMIVVPDGATISEAAALLCRGLEDIQRGPRGQRSEDRLSRNNSAQDVIAGLHGSQDDDGASSSTSSTEAGSGGSEADADPAATLTRWEDWFTLASFSHPHVMSRLERLMGTNVVRITDRKYMLELQRRIREDHVRSVRERIRAREVDELEREKKLILDGRMSLDEAPKELVDHPVFQISQFIKSVLLGGKIPGYLQAARNHVQPSRLCQMASTMSRSSSSRGVLSLSRSCLASEDGGERTLATPTTLAAAASRPPSTSASSRVASSRDTSPRDGGGSPKGSTRSARSGGSARAEDAAEATTAEVEADAEDEAAALKARGSASPAASAQSAKSVSLKDEPATSTQEAGAGGVVVQVEDGDDALLSGLSACDFEEDFDRQADIERGYMYTQEEHDRIKFEAESVKKMWELETVEELYALAESIVREMVAQDGGNVLSAPAPATAPAPSKDGDRTPSPSRSTKSPPPGGT